MNGSMLSVLDHSKYFTTLSTYPVFRKSKKGSNFKFKSRPENVKVVKLSSYTATINTLRLPIYVVGKQITRSCNFGTWKSNKWQGLLTKSRGK